jgi:predicted acetyltransferase
MGTEVRPITRDEMGAWLTAMRTGFLDKPPADGAEAEAEYRAGRHDLDHTWAAFDSGRIVATLRSFESPLTVPGGEVPSTALTHVTVATSHRRQGVLTEMLTSDLDACAARGDAVSVLVAAEYRIYGRFGYGPATEGVDFELDSLSARDVLVSAGRVERVDRETVRRAAPAIYDRVRPHQVGAIERRDWWWDITHGNVPFTPGDRPEHFALSYDPTGTPDGFVAYNAKEGWDNNRPRYRLDVLDLVGADDDVTTRLWRYCLTTDWASRVRAEHRGPADPVLWRVPDQRAITQRNRTDFMWLRILDPVSTLSGRHYLTPGRVVIEMTDPLGYARGRFALDGSPDGATCERTDGTADLTLAVNDLSAVYLGGHTLRDLARAGRVDEHRAGALATADAMFRAPVAPWCITAF